MSPRDRLSVTLFVLAALSAQLFGQASSGAWRQATLPGGERLAYHVHVPPKHHSDRPAPLVLVLVNRARSQQSIEQKVAPAWRREADAHGWVVVIPFLEGADFFQGEGEGLLRLMLRDLRSEMAIEGPRIHVVDMMACNADAFRLVEAAPYEFGSLIVKGVPDLDLETRRRLPRLRSVAVRLFAPDPEGCVNEFAPLLWVLRRAGVDARQFSAPAIWPQLLELHQSLRPAPTEEGRVGAALDAFHDAAARADADRYFGAFAPEGVFMGTDPEERWTVAAFREWAGQYFERRSAWIFVPVSRNVTLAPGGEVAAFDEVLGNASYGTCRGTGMMRRIDGAWKVVLYDLTVPVPNDLLGGIVAEIRALRDAVERGRSPAEALRPLTLYLARAAPAEEANARAAALAHALSSAGLAAVLVSGGDAARATAAEAARQAGKEVERVDASKTAALARRLRELPHGASALLVLEADALPAVLARLGVRGETGMTLDGKDDLLVLSLAPGRPPSLLRLRD